MRSKVRGFYGNFCVLLATEKIMDNDFVHAGRIENEMKKSYQTEVPVAILMPRPPLGTGQVPVQSSNEVSTSRRPINLRFEDKSSRIRERGHESDEKDQCRYPTEQQITNDLRSD
jgi:hypothetical protein